METFDLQGIFIRAAETTQADIVIVQATVAYAGSGYCGNDLLLAQQMPVRRTPMAPQHSSRAISNACSICTSNQESWNSSVPSTNRYDAQLRLLKDEARFWGSYLDIPTTICLNP